MASAGGGWVKGRGGKTSFKTIADMRGASAGSKKAWSESRKKSGLGWSSAWGKPR